MQRPGVSKPSAWCVPDVLAIAVSVIEPLGAAHARRRAGFGFDLQVHQALGRKGQHRAHEVGIGALLISARSAILASVIVVSWFRFKRRNSNPNRRPAVTAPGVRCAQQGFAHALSGTVLHHAQSRHG